MFVWSLNFYYHFSLKSLNVWIDFITIIISLCAYLRVSCFFFWQYIYTFFFFLRPQVILFKISAMNPFTGEFYIQRHFLTFLIFLFLVPVAFFMLKKKRKLLSKRKSFLCILRSFNFFFIFSVFIHFWEKKIIALDYCGQQ